MMKLCSYEEVHVKLAETAGSSSFKTRQTDAGMPHLILLTCGVLVDFRAVPKRKERKTADNMMNISDHASRTLREILITCSVIFYLLFEIAPLDCR